MRYQLAAMFALGLSSAACSSTTSAPKSDAQYQVEVVKGMHDELLGKLSALAAAARDLQTAAPVTPGRGWDATQDASAIVSMKNSWLRARSAYERVEGAIAPLFPDVDTEIDARYDDFVATLSPNGDTDPFDDQGATGMHAIERILYSDATPTRVVQFESTLIGSVPAAFPVSEAQSNEFKNKLCTKLVSDTQGLREAWQAASNYDLDAAFQGLIALMNEQREKVDKASTNEEESRYAQNTMKDVRDNLAGTRDIYAVFQPWIRSKAGKDASDASTEDGAAIDANIEAGFQSLDALYSAIPGDAIPETPSTWSSANPTPTDAVSAFGQLYLGVRDAVDSNRPASIVAQMNDAATLLGFPEFVEEQ
jgi:iron uptake system component EfeO